MYESTQSCFHPRFEDKIQFSSKSERRLRQYVWRERESHEKSDGAVGAVSPIVLALKRAAHLTKSFKKAVGERACLVREEGSYVAATPYSLGPYLQPRKRQPNANAIVRAGGHAIHINIGPHFDSTTRLGRL